MRTEYLKTVRFYFESVLELDRDDGCKGTRDHGIVLFIVVTFMLCESQLNKLKKKKLEQRGYWEQEDSRILTDGMGEDT